jgi:hypothetical protein
MLRRAFFIHRCAACTDRAYRAAAWLEHPRGARLHRQVHVIAEHRIGVDGVHDGFTKSRGCEVVKRTRRMPGISPGARQQRGEVPARGRRVAIAVDVLAQQLDLGVAGFGQPRASAITLSLVRLRSGPRVKGTTQ